MQPIPSCIGCEVVHILDCSAVYHGYKHKETNRFRLIQTSGQFKVACSCSLHAFGLGMIHFSEVFIVA